LRRWGWGSTGDDQVQGAFSSASGGCYATHPRAAADGCRELGMLGVLGGHSPGGRVATPDPAQAIYLGVKVGRLIMQVCADHEGILSLWLVW